MNNREKSDTPSRSEDHSESESSEKRRTQNGVKKYLRRKSHKTGSKPKNGRYQLDNLEKAIISELVEDGRKPFQQIARELEVDEKTVRNRVGKLRENGVLKIQPSTEANKLKGCILAIIAVNINIDARKDVAGLAHTLANLPEVSWVGITMGQYDLFIEVVVASWEHLTEFEYMTLPNVPGVGSTDSFLVLSHTGRRGVPFVERLLELDDD